MNRPVRKTIRIPGFDYATANFYFVTICTDNKRTIFGKPGQLNSLGLIAEKCILQIEKIYQGVRVDNYIVMPNHVHAIIVIDPLKDAPSLIKIVGSYKTAVTKQIRQIYPDIVVWQRSFYDHVIRNQKGYERIWEYVQYNAQKWDEDDYYQIMEV